MAFLISLVEVEVLVFPNSFQCISSFDYDMLVRLNYLFKFKDLKIRISQDRSLKLVPVQFSSSNFLRSNCISRSFFSIFGDGRVSPEKIINLNLICKAFKRFTWNRKILLQKLVVADDIFVSEVINALLLVLIFGI